MSRATFFALFVAVVLAACGGSGGDAPAPIEPPVVGSTGLVLTTANAKPAVRVAYEATMQSVGTGELVGDTGLATSPDGGFSKPRIARSLSGALTRAMQKVPLGPDTYDCDSLGTTTISGELASLFTLTIGDRIGVEYMGCDDGLGEVLNGRIEFLVADFSGDLALGLYLLEMTVTLLDFEVMTATDSVLSNGDSTVSIDTTGAPLLALGIDGHSLTTVTNSSTTTVSNFVTTQTVDGSVAPEPYTLSASGTVDSSQLGGVITYSTPVTFQGAGAAYPYAGEFLITGADNASIRLVALDESTVRIDIDADGDTVVDSTEETTWDDIAL